MLDLGTLGGRDSVARSINNNCQIVGDSLVGSGEPKQEEKRAFLWTSASGMSNLGNPLSRICRSLWLPHRASSRLSRQSRHCLLEITYNYSAIIDARRRAALLFRQCSKVAHVPVSVQKCVKPERRIIYGPDENGH
jgi:probable HAF family extracellular repeat protein